MGALHKNGLHWAVKYPQFFASREDASAWLEWATGFESRNGKKPRKEPEFGYSPDLRQALDDLGFALRNNMSVADAIPRLREMGIDPWLDVVVVGKRKPPTSSFGFTFPGKYDRNPFAQDLLTSLIRNEMKDLRPMVLGEDRLYYREILRFSSDGSPDLGHPVTMSMQREPSPRGASNEYDQIEVPLYFFLALKLFRDSISRKNVIPVKMRNPDPSWRTSQGDLFPGFMSRLVEGRLHNHQSIEVFLRALEAYDTQELASAVDHEGVSSLDRLRNALDGMRSGRFASPASNVAGEGPLAHLEHRFLVLAAQGLKKDVDRVLANTPAPPEGSASALHPPEAVPGSDVSIRRMKS